MTVLGFVLQGDPDLQARLVNSTLAELPIIGSQLRENVHSLKGSGAGLAVGILAMLYGCLGAAGATQNAFNRAWAVPRNERPNPIALRLRSVLLLLVLGAGVLVTTTLAGLATAADAFGDRERRAWHRRDPAYHARERWALHGRLPRAHGL